MIIDINEKKVYEFCDTKWKYYIKRDGAYYPSKHDDLVLNEAASEFNITFDEAKAIFNKVSNEIVQEEVKGMSQNQIRNAIKDVIEGNAETPWGQEKLKKKKDNN
ncbi:hypothetical protein [Pseudobacteroides cellulosolvens]|uniref:Uncharacterized protein n=2 Tax=Pseudobacteroides cellulosolvens TaxID=35825 RepID=A0A0L6JKN7_9FIRM|nr:hypothetical protein [Pseudobacteroides cellulosolvens]KNY26349.1 hypothetical protein Bccel_1611 [Pseudobacteroides cellulosolvens ATCC 35603 = DSM 2933]